MKKNYKSGTYRLTKENDRDTILIQLTAAQAKALMTNMLYDRLGYSIIEFVKND